MRVRVPGAVRQRPAARLISFPASAGRPAQAGVRPAPNGRAPPKKGEAQIRATLTTLAAAAAILAYPADAQAAGGCNTRECTVRVLSKQCSNSQPRACVRWIIARHRIGGWQAAWLLRIPSCESGWNPYARNPSGASGLYQFLPSTWRTTHVGHLSIWSARAQAQAAAFMLRQGRSREWVCQ